MSAIKIFYLEMRSAKDFRAKEQPENLQVIESEIKEYRFNRYLYQLIGETWSWTDKLSLSSEQWQDYAENDNLRTYVAYHKGSIAGYYELQQQSDGDVEIVYFGLAPKFLGMGFGGYLLSHAIKSAWSWEETKRVWVHTCSLDHESALPNYQARGMLLYKTEIAPSI
ncbi:GNAT family N-acetyltransferase [Psychromonas sp. MME1]|uniref:GNAT family N-acetyltransferase n=1 Tax=Psychromonas sp. MME1 TaxID=3231032 RepID=UPI0034E1FC3B